MKPCMEPPMLMPDLGGLHTFAFRHQPSTFTAMNSARLGRWRLSVHPIRACGFLIATGTAGGLLYPVG